MTKKQDCLVRLRGFLAKEPVDGDPPKACVAGAIAFIDNFLGAPTFVITNQDEDGVIVECDEDGVIKSFDFFADGSIEFTRFEDGHCVTCVVFQNPLKGEGGQ